MIYKNWKDLKPLTAPVPVGTKVVVVSRYAVPCGAIGSVQWSDDKGLWVCFEENYSRYYTFSALALLPTQSTMTEQEKWQFGGIDLDACECVEHEGKRYPWVNAGADGERLLLFVIGDGAVCLDRQCYIDREQLLVHTRPFKALTPVLKKPQLTTRPWTQDEMLELLRKGGVEIQKKSGEWISGALYYIDKSNELCIDADNFDQCIAYRSQETNWESRPLTKVVE